MVKEPYSNGLIEKVNKFIAQAGFEAFEEEVFEIARWSEDLEGKLRRISEVLQTLTQEKYRLSSTTDRSGDYKRTIGYLERKTRRDKPLLRYWRYRWVSICSIVSGKWTNPLNIFRDDTSDPEYMLLRLIADVQNEFKIPQCGDPYSNTINSIVHRLETGREDAILSVPSDEYVPIALELAKKRNTFRLVRVRR